MKLNKSKQRDIILEELKKVDTHPTANEVYIMVQKKLPNISLGTVYRNLEVLSTRKEILKLEKFTGPTRFDGNIIQHYHCQCEICGSVSDIFPEKKDKLNYAIKDFIDHNNINFYCIEFYGECKKCSV